MRLLKLPAEVQLAIRNQQISMGHARALVNIEDHSKLMKLFRKTISEAYSVRKVESLAKEIKEGSAESKPAKEKAELSFTQQKFLEDLNTHLGSKATLSRDSGGKGKMVIPFKSDNDLERIIDLLDL